MHHSYLYFNELAKILSEEFARETQQLHSHSDLKL